MSKKSRSLDFGTGSEAFDLFHISTYGEKRWKKMKKALLKPVDHIAVVNPMTPPHWIAKELHRIGAVPVEEFDEQFTGGLGIYKLSQAESLATGYDKDGNLIYDFNNDSLKLDSNGNVLTRWPAQLPKVGFQPGDLGLDFDTIYINPSNNDQKKKTTRPGVDPNVTAGPQNFGGMKGRVGYYLLDAASICAPLLLNPQPGEKVVDVCAAPGGKSLILSYLLFARNEASRSSITINETLNRWRSGGLNTNDITSQMLSSLKNSEKKNNTNVENNLNTIDEMDLSDDEDDYNRDFNIVSEEDMHRFDEIHMKGHTIDETKVERFLTLMYGIYDNSTSEVEEDILRGLMRNNTNVSLTTENPEGKEVNLDIEELINRELASERALRKEREVNTDGVRVFGKDKKNDLVHAGYMNAGYYDAQNIIAKKIAKQKKMESESESESEDNTDDEEESYLQRRTKLVLNDISRFRTARLQQVIRDYLPLKIQANITVINSDASNANNFSSVTHTATGLTKLASNVSKSKAKANLKVENKKSIQFPPGDFDCLLLDAPCSSDRHVLHSYDDLSKWNIQVTLVQAKRQVTLLEAAIKSLKIGGRMVYSTCSISPYENDMVVKNIITKFGKDTVRIIDMALPIGMKTEFGWLIVPGLTKGPWGPLFISYLERLR